MIALNADKKKALEELIKEYGIVVSHEPIKLSSGKETHHYYDIKPAILRPKGLKLVGELGIEVAGALGAKSVGGLESGAIPIATAIARESENALHPMAAFFVRKNQKQYGLKKFTEGCDIVSPALIVDDVITTGSSTMKAVEEVRKSEGQIAGILAVVDREEGAAELFKEKGIRFFSIFTHSNFKDHIEKKLDSFRKNAETYLSSA